VNYLLAGAGAAAGVVAGAAGVVIIEEFY